MNGVQAKRKYKKVIVGVFSFTDSRYLRSVYYDREELCLLKLMRFGGLWVEVSRSEIYCWLYYQDYRIDGLTRGTKRKALFYQWLQFKIFTALSLKYLFHFLFQSPMNRELWQAWGEDVGHVLPNEGSSEVLDDKKMNEFLC